VCKKLPIEVRFPNRLDGEDRAHATLRNNLCEKKIKMSSASTQIRFVGVVLGAAVLSIAVLAVRNVSQTPSNKAGVAPLQDVPSCSGGSSHPRSAPPSPGANPHPHSVILSWNASVPASKSPRDAIQGYHVYRRATPGTYGEKDRISELPVQGTRCLDATVQPQKTYYYAVKAVSQNGTRSSTSAEIRVVVPFP
jgi:hypothetical protein